MANEVRIKLTDAQKAKIKEATGQELPEIRVGNLGNNPAVSTRSSSPTKSPRAGVMAARAGIQSMKPAIAAKATRSNIHAAKRS